MLCPPPQTILVRVTGLDRPGITSDLLTLLANLDAADASDVPNDSHAA
jgi:predicted amino acid-binding ACT domain protein